MKKITTFVAHFSKLCHSTNNGTVGTTTPKNSKVIRKDSEINGTTAGRFLLKTGEKTNGLEPIETLPKVVMATHPDPKGDEMNLNLIAGRIEVDQQADTIQNLNLIAGRIEVDQQVDIIQNLNLIVDRIKVDQRVDTIQNLNLIVDRIEVDQQVDTIQNLNLVADRIKGDQPVDTIQAPQDTVVMANMTVKAEAIANHRTSDKEAHLNPTEEEEMNPNPRITIDPMAGVELALIAHSNNLRRCTLLLMMV